MDRAAARQARRAARLDPARPAGPARPPCLGVDVGGVVVDLVAEDSDTSFFGRRPLETPAVPGVFDELGALVRDAFAGRAVVVSKAGPRVAARTLEWMHHHDFFGRTGITRQAVHFVRQRVDKAGVCEQLGVTHFVDDRPDVLGHLVTVSHRYLFIGGRGRRHRTSEVPPGVVVAETWPQLAALVRVTVPPGRQTAHPQEGTR